jgi:hypothetical protein
VPLEVAFELLVASEVALVLVGVTDAFEVALGDAVDVGFDVAIGSALLEEASAELLIDPDLSLTSADRLHSDRVPTSSHYSRHSHHSR